MAKKSTKTSKSEPDKNNLLQRLSLFFFLRPRKTALIWVLITVFGFASYSTLLKREGFPSIETPYAVMQGTYLVNDPAKVDSEVGKPLGEFLLKQAGVKRVQTQSFGNAYVATIAYDENVNSETRSQEIQTKLQEEKVIPAQATGTVKPFLFGFTERGDDLVVSFYGKNNGVTDELLVKDAEKAAAYLKSQNLSTVEDVSAINPFEAAINASGQSEQTQRSFDRYGKREGDKNNFYNSVVIGVKAKEGADELELDKQVRQAVASLNSLDQFQAYQADVSASNAPSINMQISELQKTLLEGLLVVLLVGSIVIAVRASIITVISMVTVLATVIGLFYVVGYSLNTITLFGLILGLSLIVDDTIIMVEAIDARRRRSKNPKEIVRTATGKVGKAMIAATLTACLSFAPLLFVGGIIGSFVRAIPVTIIAALLISLLVALVFIPFFSRFLLLGKNQVGEKNTREFAANFEARVARFLSAPMLWAKGSRLKLFGVGITALVVGFGFIGAGGALFQYVKFSIFPTDKDSNTLSMSISYAPGTPIAEQQRISDNATKILGDELGDNFVKASYYGSGGSQMTMLQIDIKDYKDREITAPQIVENVSKKFESFNDASVKVNLLGVGPPTSAFAARVDSSQNREAASRLATDIGNFLEKTEIKRPDGTVAKIDNVNKPSDQLYTRSQNNAYVEASASFVDDDTSALVTLTQAAVEKEFPDSRIESYGLKADALTFDFGQEDENQDSFTALIYAFPILLGVIYILLAIQFRSMLQPLLIFMAIPFSIFGITLGLFITDNPFSFFAMLGFFALIGLSIKNTILLTDYANQARAAGMDAVDAAHEALAERFRPLIATSLTAVVSLIPLAITSPFWEGLTVVLIFGLLSSTFLVVTVFPYYYLGAEFLRLRINRRTGIAWIILTIALVFGLSKLAVPLVIVAPFAAALIIRLVKRLLK